MGRGNTNTFFGIVGQVVQNTLRLIINFGRLYPLAAASCLVTLTFTVYSYTPRPVEPIAHPAPSSSSSVPEPSEAPVAVPTPASTTPSTADYYSVPVPPIPPPVVDVATPKAYRNGDTITIRWNKPVSRVQITVDGFLLKPDCEGRVGNICTAILAQGSELEVSWWQGTNDFSTKMRL